MTGAVVGKIFGDTNFLTERVETFEWILWALGADELFELSDVFLSGLKHGLNLTLLIVFVFKVVSVNFVLLEHLAQEALFHSILLP